MCLKFNSLKMCGLDLCKDMDNIIGEYIEDLEGDLYECGACGCEDLINELNFKNCCYSCNIMLCVDCIELIRGGEWLDDLEGNEIYIENMNENNDLWICGECSGKCESCNLYVCEDFLRGLITLIGECVSCCCNCINTKNLDFNYNGDSYLKEGSLLEEVYNIDINNIDTCGCEDFIEDCDICELNNICDNCKCVDKNSEEMLFDRDNDSCICLECNKYNGSPFRECYSCEEIKDCKRVNIYVFDKEGCGDKEDFREVCEKCVELNIHYM